MMAALWQIGATSAALALLLPFAIRFDLKALGRLPLHVLEGLCLLWPIRTWVRALGKRGAYRDKGWWIVALSGGALLTTAAAVICSGWTVLVWAMAIYGVVRTILAVYVAFGSALPANRGEVLAEGLLSTTVWAMALVGPAVLMASDQILVPSQGCVLARQPAAALALCLGVAGSWVDPICGRLAPTLALAFHRLHADGQSAWLVTDGYIWRIAGLAAWTGGFLPSADWITRLVVVIIGLLVILWLRQIYVIGLRRRLGGR
ncbi:MAG: hypothetical protein ACP5G7_11895, partial [Anaerolineae bacterium]